MGRSFLFLPTQTTKTTSHTNSSSHQIRFSRYLILHYPPSSDHDFLMLEVMLVLFLRYGVDVDVVDFALRSLFKTSRQILSWKTSWFLYKVEVSLKYLNYFFFRLKKIISPLLQPMYDSYMTMTNPVPYRYMIIRYKN